MFRMKASIYDNVGPNSLCQLRSTARLYQSDLFQPLIHSHCRKSGARPDQRLLSTQQRTITRRGLANNIHYYRAVIGLNFAVFLKNQWCILKNVYKITKRLDPLYRSRDTGISDVYVKIKKRAVVQSMLHLISGMCQRRRFNFQILSLHIRLGL